MLSYVALLLRCEYIWQDLIDKFGFQSEGLFMLTLTRAMIMAICITLMSTINFCLRVLSDTRKWKMSKNMQSFFFFFSALRSVNSAWLALPKETEFCIFSTDQRRKDGGPRGREFAMNFTKSLKPPTGFPQGQTELLTRVAEKWYFESCPARPRLLFVLSPFQNSESERKRFSEKGCQAKKSNHDELKIPKICNYQNAKNLSERCRHEERPRLGSGLRLPCAQYCNIMISLAINNLWDLPKCTKEGGKVCGMGGAQCTLSPESSSKNEAPMLVVGCHAQGTQPAPPQSVRQLLQPGGFRRKVGAKFPAGFRLRENALWVSAQLVGQPPGKDRNTGNPRIGFPFGICNLWQMLLTLKDVNLRNVGAHMPSNLRGG